MRTVVKRANQRASKSVKENLGVEGASTMTHASQASETAAYIAEMCGDLAIMAKKADLVFLAHLLAMAQAEANYHVD